MEYAEGEETMYLHWISHNLFNCAAKGIITFIFVSSFKCVRNMMLHEYESLTTEAAENISSADGKYF